MTESEAIPVSVRLTKRELKEFDEAIERSGKFVNRSDAIRTLIREFIERVRREISENHNRNNKETVLKEVD